jgi:phospholipid/cholesterol/gamma-HCH transport system ATP-binding protein
MYSEPKTDPTNKAELIIAISGLFKSFNNIPVLSGIDLEVFKGQNTVVLGRSGSGKSVLIKIIAGLLKPDAGSVMVMGKEVDKLSKKDLRALRLKIGFMFQDSALWDSMTVYDNIKFSFVRYFENLRQNEVKLAIKEILDSLGLEGLENKMPAQLSGGQRKRVGIARTLILHPDLMLYDEPTAGLDPITSEEINELIRVVQKRYNTTSIIITHDLTCAKATGDEIAMLHEGKFIRKGDFSYVFNCDDQRITSFYNYNFIS